MRIEQFPGENHARAGHTLLISLPTNVREFVAYLALPLGYFFGAKLGFALTAFPQPISMLWPPNAILLAALLLTPKVRWPLLIVLTFPAHLAAKLGANVPLLMVTSWFATNVSEALIGAFCIRYLLGSVPDFEKLRDVCVFLICGVLLAPFLSSFLDVGLVKLIGGHDDSFWSLWRIRFLSNVLAVLVLVPVILGFLQSRPLSLIFTGTVWHRLEAAALFVTTLLICFSAFADVGFGRYVAMSMLFVLVPLLLWAALRFRPAYVSHLILLVTLFGIWGAQHWQGPLINSSNLENVLALQLFLLCIAAPILMLAAVLCQLRDTEVSLSRKSQHLQMALQAAQVTTWSWDVKPEQGPGADTTALPDFFPAIHPEDQPDYRAALQRAFATASPFEIEIRMQRDDGSYGWMENRGAPRFDAGGNLCCFWGVNADTSRRRQEAGQIQQQRNELAHLSRVAMLGEMSGAIAHELNQPLTAILSNAQAARRVLQRAADSSLIPEIVDDVIAESKRAGEIIQRMRELLKKGTVQTGVLDINQIVPKVIVLEHSDLIGRNVAVVTDLQSDLPCACADSVQLQQVLLNLIANACDAMRESAISHRLIKITTRSDDEGFVHICVRDRGTGIPEEKLEEIFEPFYSNKCQGLGLGLTICRSIIVAHGGRLWATNNADGGATFHVKLPIAKATSDLSHAL